MKHALHSFWLGAGLSVLVGISAVVFAQPLLDSTGDATVGNPGQGNPSMAGEPFLTPGLTPEQRTKVRFHKRRGRMELRHRGLELMDSVYEVSTDPARAAILHIQRIERIYRKQRDQGGLKAFYQDVLTRTDNLAIRNVAYLKLSELTVHGKDIEGALALLEQGLEENLRQVE
jgi:hypothetical protein